jgi:hypothetical protein
MNHQDLVDYLRSFLAKLGARATKGQKEFLSLIQKMLDGKVKVSENKTFDRLARTQENRPMIYDLLDLLCRCGVFLIEHEVASDILQLLKKYL